VSWSVVVVDEVDDEVEVEVLLLVELDEVDVDVDVEVEVLLLVELDEVDVDVVLDVEVDVVVVVVTHVARQGFGPGLFAVPSAAAKSHVSEFGCRMPSPQIVHGSVSFGARHSFAMPTGQVGHSPAVFGTLPCGFVSQVSTSWFTVPSPQQFTNTRVDVVPVDGSPANWPVTGSPSSVPAPRTSSSTKLLLTPSRQVPTWRFGSTNVHLAKSEPASITPSAAASPNGPVTG
jgi:hypothetical protein